MSEQIVTVKDIEAATTLEICRHDELLGKAAKHSNDQAYHHGQASKLSRARRLLRDVLEAEERFAETTAAEAAGQPDPNLPEPTE